MFHWKDKIYFGRLPDGSVRILKLKESQTNNPDITGEYLGAELDLVIPTEHWASIVSSVSYAGEESGRWYKAMDFHNGTDTFTQTGFKD